MFKHATSLLMLISLTSCQLAGILANNSTIEGIAISETYYPPDFRFDDLKETIQLSVISPEKYYGKKIYVYFPSLPEDSPLKLFGSRFEYQINSDYFKPHKSNEVLSWKTISYDSIKLKRIIPPIEIIYKGEKEFNQGEKITIHAFLKNNTQHDLYVCLIYGLNAYVEEREIIIGKTNDSETIQILGGQQVHHGGYCRIEHRLILDEKTNSLVCKQFKSELPEINDFVVIQPGFSMPCKCELEIDPEYPIGATNLFLIYESDFDGNNLGIKANTEIPETIVKINIKNPTSHSCGR